METIKIKDFSVSKEDFLLVYDKKYELYKTEIGEIKLEKYYKSENYISHNDANSSFFDRIYQIVKKKSLTNKIKLVNHFCKNKGNILDIGAGTGDFLRIAKKNGWQISGIEPSEIARENALKKEILLNETSEEILKQTIKFDCITLWHSLEHIPDLEKQLQFLNKIIKPDGTLIIAIPNFKSKDAQIYKEFWAGFDVPRHIWHFSQKSVQLIFKEINFKIIAKKPMYFDSFYIALLSEKYKTGKMKPIKAFFNGLLSNISAIKNNEFSSIIYILKRK